MKQQEIKKSIVKVCLGGYQWSIRFLPSSIIGNNLQGYTWTNKRCIDILEELDEEALKITLTHELVHALLDTQGRCFQKNFNLEDMCEFIAWNIDEIIKVREKILREE